MTSRTLLKKNFFQTYEVPIFNALTNLHNPNKILDNLYNMFNINLNRHAKVNTKRVKTESQPKWLTQELNDADYYQYRLRKLSTLGK